MSKANPLFVDSTKFHGDAIGTHVELKNVLIYEDEELFIVITTHQGIALRVAMRCAEDERTYEARVHLNHQKNITYHFAIEKNGKTVLQSTSRRVKAQYAIIEDWQPALPGIIPASETQEAITSPAPSAGGPKPDLAWTREYSSTVKSLIDKWGL